MSPIENELREKGIELVRLYLTYHVIEYDKTILLEILALIIWKLNIELLVHSIDILRKIDILWSLWNWTGLLCCWKCCPRLRVCVVLHGCFDVVSEETLFILEKIRHVNLNLDGLIDLMREQIIHEMTIKFLNVEFFNDIKLFQSSRDKLDLFAIYLQ